MKHGIAEGKAVWGSAYHRRWRVERWLQSSRFRDEFRRWPGRGQAGIAVRTRRRTHDPGGGDVVNRDVGNRMFVGAEIRLRNCGKGVFNIDRKSVV